MCYDWNGNYDLVGKYYSILLGKYWRNYRMAALDDLINQISDVSLREQIRLEVKRLNQNKKFGLVFEEHLEDAVPLYDIPVKRGSVVAKRDGQLNDKYYVEKIDGGQATCFNKITKERVVLPIDTLVCVSQLGEPIYPYLKPIDSVCNAPNSDLWHALIEADNYHALQLLNYLYAGKVDCIYIDPPYNTGAKDWKYNNNYVDSSDAYRHSKWLSFMEKRLKLAKKLLNPKDSVLIVTIDEKEYLHLGCLLEEMFSGAKMQMVSSVINHASVARFNEFNRNNEYIFFVMFGNCELQSIDDSKTATKGTEVAWNTLRRHSPSNLRSTRPRQFYPIYINTTTNKIEEIGNPIPPNVDRHSVVQRKDCVAVFPIRDNGTEMLWGVIPSELKRRLKGGYVRIGKFDPTKPQQYGIQVLPSGPIARIESGELDVSGYREDGSVIVYLDETKKVLPKTQWDYVTHDAKVYGSNIVRSIFADSRFSYPKSVYAVKDAIKLFTSHKPNALILDFFAGSGTTLHAVNLLNAEDGGHRRCIMVTNNEVSDAEAISLTRQGYRPGDEEWEKWGIARYVTWPRTVCAIEGHDVNGNPLKGSYLGSDIPMADGFKANAIYFKLGFLDKNAVELGRQFKELLSVLWMKAGAYGRCPTLDDTTELPAMLILPENHFAVLTEESQYEAFRSKVNSEESITTVYIVTDSESGYRDMISGLHVTNTYQLYRDYLDNFRIKQGRY